MTGSSPTLVVAETTLITSSVAKIIVLLAEITFKVRVTSSSVAPITFVVTEITFFIG